MSLAARVATAAINGAPRFLDRRFDGSGGEVSCPGNTVIAHIYDTAALQALTAAQSALAATEAGACFAWLPKSSLHCTLFNGLLYAERDAAHWPRTLPFDASRNEADAHMATGFHETAVPETAITMCPDAMRGLSSDALGVSLSPSTPDTNKALRAYRDRLAAATGLAHRPGHDDYIFHITLGYLIAWPTPKAAAAFDAVADQQLSRLKQELPYLLLAKSEYTRFAGMTHFAVQSSKDLPKDQA